MTDTTSVDGSSLPSTAGTRLVGSLLVGTAIGAAATWAVDGPVGVLAGIAALHGVFVLWGWRVLWPLTADLTRAHARREDVRPSVEEILVVGAAVGALVAIAMLLLQGHSRLGWLAAALALVGVFLSWGSLHLMYSARYAHLFYDAEGGGGIDFNQQDPPTFRDFLYFSYNLGMTYQVSDTAVSSARVRAVVLRHCLFSYVFGAVVLASTINAVAQVISG